MKKLIISIPILIFVLIACTDKFEDFNSDKKNPYEVPGNSLFSNAQKQLADFITNTNVNVNIFLLMSQYWTETTYTDEANYDLVNRNISANIFSRMYLRVLRDLQEAQKIISEETLVPVPGKDLATLEKERTNRLMIIELMNVYVYSELVNIFGAIPYSEALNIENVYPKYENGPDVYNDLFIRLETALNGLDDSYGSFGDADLYYSGKVDKWIRFANSLKLKLAITIADSDPSKAEAAVSEAYSNVFQSNDDNCLLRYMSIAPNYNQLYADLVASGRHDFVPANTLVDTMNYLDDPRRDAYFKDKIDTSTTPGDVKLAYVGGIYGYSNSYNQCSHIGAWIHEPNFPGIIMTYHEVCFYLAEAAERWNNVNKTAQEWYEEGITASFDFWGVGGAADYIANPNVNYSSASGDWRHKIGVQSWIANYISGIVAYNNWRRLDYPILNLPEYASDYTDIPVRFTFPINEQSLNKDNYNAAVEMIGSDDIKTKVFWDIY